MKVPQKIHHQVSQYDPKEHRKNIMEECKNLQKNVFGIRVIGTPIEMASENLKKPTIIVGKKQKITPKENGNFDYEENEFHTPATIGKWLILYNGDEKDDAKRKINLFLNEAKKRGIKLDNKQIRWIYKREKNGLLMSKYLSKKYDDLFESLQNDQIQCLWIIDDNRNAHGILKLMERKYEIVTQQITLKVFDDKFQNYIVRANILNKFNVKNGGINYIPIFNEKVERLNINAGKVLVISYDVSHPIPYCYHNNQTDCNENRELSTVGIVSNDTKNPSIFFGDFFYQKAGEILNQSDLKKKTIQILTNLKDSGRETEIIIILRDGLSEDQFEDALKKELEAIKTGCKKFNSELEFKFIFIVTIKRHHARFFVNKNGESKNPLPGTCISGTHRIHHEEFFIASHEAIMGTTKFIKIGVLLNEPLVKLDEIKHFIHGLCYGHQILTRPTSLPTPVFMADELASRGAQLYKESKKIAPKKNPGENDEVDYDKLTEEWGYSTSKLNHRRVNA